MDDLAYSLTIPSYSTCTLDDLLLRPLIVSGTYIPILILGTVYFPWRHHLEFYPDRFLRFSKLRASFLDSRLTASHARMLIKTTNILSHHIQHQSANSLCDTLPCWIFHFLINGLHTMITRSMVFIPWSPSQKKLFTWDLFLIKHKFTNSTCDTLPCLIALTTNRSRPANASHTM